MVHVTDWYQTLLAATGIEVGYHRSKRVRDSKDDDEEGEEYRVDLDGKNVWNAIQFGEIDKDISTESRELLLDLNPKWCPFSSCGTIRVGPWKFIRGTNMASNTVGEDGDHWQKLSVSLRGTCLVT